MLLKLRRDLFAAFDVGGRFEGIFGNRVNCLLCFIDLNILHEIAEDRVTRWERSQAVEVFQCVVEVF